MISRIRDQLEGVSPKPCRARARRLVDYLDQVEAGASGVEPEAAFELLAILRHTTRQAASGEAALRELGDLAIRLLSRQCDRKDITHRRNRWAL